VGNLFKERQKQLELMINEEQKSQEEALDKQKS